MKNLSLHISSLGSSIRRIESGRPMFFECPCGSKKSGDAEI